MHIIRILQNTYFVFTFRNSKEKNNELTCEYVGEGIPPCWLLLFSFEIKLPTGDGECGAEEADFSIPIIAEDGGDTDRFRPPETEADIKGLDVTANGSLLLGRGHRGGGAFAPAFVGGAVMPPGPPTVDEALITAAAALGAERLLSGTRGVLKIAVIKKKNQ